MGFIKEQCVVVKFHDIEKYAVAVFGGTKEECLQKLAYCNGLYHGLSYIKFGVYKESQYEFCRKEEITGGRKVYETLPLIS